MKLHQHPLLWQRRDVDTGSNARKEGLGVAVLILLTGRDPVVQGPFAQRLQNGAQGRPGFGMLLDEKHGRLAMFEANKHKFDWIGRPVERPGTRPLKFEFTQDIGSELIDWPLHHTIKCLCFYHPDDPAELKAEQQEKLRTLYDAARKVGRELLVEIIAGKHGPLDDHTIERALIELYDLGIRPDWWKLEPQANISAWRNIEAVINKRDPWCRGVVLLGLEAPQNELEAAFKAVADIDVVKGFAIGRAAVHQEQALVLVNLGGASAMELIALAAHVRDSVEQKFGVVLEHEVRFMGLTGETWLDEVLA